MATYKCLECGHIFDEGEEWRWVESHGEHMTGCPICGCAYDEACQCDKCGAYHLSDELYSGLCADCLGDMATPQNIADYAESDTLLAEDFYAYYYDSFIAGTSVQLRQLLRGGLLQRASLELLNGHTDTQEKCRKYITEDEEHLTDFAEWIKKKGKRNDSKTREHGFLK